MAEYIEREAFIKRLEHEADISNGIIDLLILNGIANIVRDKKIAPTADVEKVVRCKDCKSVHIDMNGCYVCVNNGLLRKANDFCSYGKRRDLINDKL